MSQWFPLRTVENCAYRRLISGAGSTETAHCEWLLKSVPTAADLLTPISREACHACCQSFPPTVQRPNPVTASLLMELAMQIQSRGGIPGCSASDAERLLRNSMRCTSVDEEDLKTDEDFAACQRVPAEPIHCSVPVPSERSESRIREWAVGITTAPRRKPTVEYCLQSIRQAGWSSLYLFVDGLCHAPGNLDGVTSIVRETSVGAWSNYWLTLSELVLRQPTADAYLVVQDDAVFDARSELREYLEQALWPGTEPCIVSLYGSSVYTADRLAGWQALPEPWVWGAVAFVFPREIAFRMLTDRELFNHRSELSAGVNAGIDVAIGCWAERHKIPIWFPTPSLVQHIGHASVIWTHGGATDRRRADRFSSDVPLP